MTGKNQSRRSWLGAGENEGGWIAHRLKLLLSPAWQRRPRPLCRILERLEIEHLRHAGRENGRLCVSFDQFVEYGVSRRVIRHAIEAGVSLGLLDVVQPEAMVRNIKAPNEYRLTYVPAGNSRAPSDEWEDVTESIAIAAAEVFRRSTGEKQDAGSLSRATPVPFPASKPAASSVPPK
jgi:hypothetical protein